MLNRRGRGFTLVELLSVVGVVATVIALAIPAVQQAREAARCIQCRNNLKQLALALHSYHDVQGQLPSAAYCGAYCSSSIEHCHTWLESLLPFLEQSAKFHEIDFNVANHVDVNPAVLNGWQLNALICPSDPDSGLYPNSRERLYTPCERGAGRARCERTPLGVPCEEESLGASYIPSAGPLHMNLCPIPAMEPNINCLGADAARRGDHAPGMFTGGWRGYRFAACTDGVSNTFLLGETLPVYNTFHMYFASHLHVGSTNPPPNYHKSHTACSPARTGRVGDDCYAHMSGFKSQHAVGVQMALADGSVRLIHETIDYPTWCHLGNKSDGRILEGF